METGNQRPGVYSSYSVISRYAPPRSRYAAAVVMNGYGLAEGIFAFSGYGEAAEQLNPAQQAVPLRALRILFESGVGRVYLCCTGEEPVPMLQKLADMADIGIVICDTADEDDLYDLIDSVQEASENLRERLLFVGVAGVADALRAAGTLGHERAVVVSPAAAAYGDETARAIYTACAFAGAVLAQSDPAHSFSGEALETLTLVEPLAESDVQSLLAGGVTVLESASGIVECVRAVTSRTRTDGTPDLSLRSLNTVLIIDDVMRSVRSGLKALLRGLRAGSAAYETIASQAAVILAARRDEGLLDSFSAPQVHADASDPGVCVVELSFGVAGVVEQIRISAHIRI